MLVSKAIWAAELSLLFTSNIAADYDSLSLLSNAASQDVTSANISSATFCLLRLHGRL